MGDTTYCTGQDYLSQLPAELLSEIFHLLNTSSRTWAVFNSRASEIVKAVLNSTVPVQTRVHMRQLSQNIIATPAQLRNFARLSHSIHVLAHLYIDRCLQRCLNSPLLQRGYPMGFRDPTWTEEQRMIPPFWRVVFFNELKLEGLRSHLDWSPIDLEQLRDHGPYRQFGGLTPRFQASTALRYILEEMNPEGSEEEFSGDTGQPFELPKLPMGMEFGLAGQPPPSLRAVNQGWDAADPPPKSTATPKPETRWIPERRNLTLWPTGLRDTLRLGCLLRMESSSEESLISESPPSGPDNIPPVPFLIQNFGQIPPKEEWRVLHGKTIGVHFWYHMCDNRKEGPCQYTSSGLSSIWLCYLG
ncbi:uncharacterized protein BDW43DRAFT_298733 [Aspergillus alliaceus]|uniref:uncharacterized protein n=1 Tax=Petromyces alliaceus TaxID=209559 RepID=UPI0012A571F9|nr:uncharacterized protein BDW43DRAFT_298733 [Aspergillus alliaceus]KAB8235686.1 hypothetical protein BDW43DRAFT_298733 [Aspergillus alliaceus]